jgi:hypothetical protein
VNDNAESGNGNILAHPMKSYIDSQIDIKLGGDGGGGNMSELIKRVGAIEIDVAVIKSNYATKTDIAELKTELKADILGIKADISNASHTQTKWIIATIVTVISASIAIQRLLPPQQSAQFPTVINQPAANK